MGFPLVAHAERISLVKEEHAKLLHYRKRSINEFRKFEQFLLFHKAHLRQHKLIDT